MELYHQTPGHSGILKQDVIYGRALSGTLPNEQKATQQRDQTERDIALDNQREAALQAYIDSMSALLLEKDLRKSKESDEVRTIARVRTLTVLPRLDGKRKARVLQFLFESDLIKIDKKIIDLTGANLIGAVLRRADLFGANLREADLQEANMGGANLTGANLGGADLLRANLGGANLFGANMGFANLREANLSETNLGRGNLSFVSLREADLSGADLSGAKVTDEQFKYAKSLKGAIMQDGTKHD